MPHPPQETSLLNAPVPDGRSASEEVRKQVDRILAGDTLRAAEALRRLLRFLADKTFSGEADGLKEYSVGLDGLGKPSSYDPRHDAGVRLQASRLRQKLDDYYRGEGAHDPVIIELPKGGFRLSWRLRESEAPPETPVSPLPIPPQPIAPEKVPPGVWSRLAIGLALSTLVFMCVAAWLAWNRIAPARPGLSPELRAIWSPFIGSTHPLIIAFSDPLFVRFRQDDSPDILLHRRSVTNWDEESHSPEFSLLSRSLPHARAEPSYDFVMRSELVSTFVLGQFFASRRADVSVTRLGELSWQQLAENDVILLSSRFRADERQSDLPVQLAFVFSDRGIRNLKPLPGEPDMFANSMEHRGSDGESLELVSVMPGPLGRTRVISFAGNRSWAVLGAVQSLTDPAFAKIAVDRLKGGASTIPRFYQIVMKTVYRGGTAISSTCLAHRELKDGRGIGVEPGSR
jgi:hypothetical protein